jgi:hypothetical protein
MMMIVFPDSDSSDFFLFKIGMKGKEDLVFILFRRPTDFPGNSIYPINPFTSVKYKVYTRKPLLGCN